MKEDTGYCITQLSSKCKKKGGKLPIKDFYVATSKFFTNGKMPICKHCIKEYVYGDSDTPNVERFREILRIIDFPFFEATWKTSFDDKNETIGIYFKNIILNFKDKTWQDSDSVFTFTNVDLGESEKVIKSYDDKVLIKKWGKGFSLDDLHWLEDNYNTWKERTNCSELPVQKLVKRICIRELRLRQAEEQDKPTEKIEEALLKLMTSSNLTPKTMSSLNENDSQKAFGTWIRDIEKYRPAEYFEDKKLYEDYDHIKEYFERFIKRPLKNLLTGSRDFDGEFNIEEEKDSFEDDE